MEYTNSNANGQPRVTLGEISRRNVLMGLVSIASLGILGTAACGAVQPAQDLANPNANQGQGGNGGQGGRGQGFRTTPAPELPTTQADVSGLFISRDGVTLIVGAAGFNGQFNGTRQAPNGTRQAPNGTRQAPDPNATRAPYAGAETKVVTNEKTKLYQDVTQFNTQDAQNNQSMQQKVKLVDSLDVLLGADASNGTVSAWGQKNADGQLVANTIVFRPRQLRPTPTA